MSLINVFKKKPSVSPKKKKGVKAKPVKKVEKEIKLNQNFRVLRFPHTSEKATDLLEKDQYIFRVFPETNKIEIKKAIEKFYGINVLSVRIVNIPKKKKRLGRIVGFKPGYKKAIVKIKKGQTIDLLPK